MAQRTSSNRKETQGMNLTSEIYNHSHPTLGVSRKFNLVKFKINPIGEFVENLMFEAQRKFIPFAYFFYTT